MINKQEAVDFIIQSLETSLEASTVTANDTDDIEHLKMLQWCQSQLPRIRKFLSPKKKSC